jgi:transcriptional regulator with XRE-family HTH domain
MIQEIRDLHRVRLERDLTYRELAEAMGMSERGVRLLLTMPKPKPWERTLHKVRQFLAKCESQDQQVVSR